ncbi:MAG: class I SAM-dependent methyltransferase [Bryobacterales bacterium]|nr:class I SAM-dependent methyltransferase [Bryobacterales bacterium]
MSISPAAYRRWRQSPLGALTEKLEQRAVLSLAGNPSGRSVLDVGCGDGAYSIRAALAGGNAVGLDRSRPMLDAARTESASTGVPVDWCQGHAQALPFRDGAFDLVLAVTVLCTVPEPVAALREISRVLRPGGIVVAGELGRWSLWALRRRIRGWLGNQFWRTARFWTAAELRGMLTAAGLKPGGVRHAVYFPPSAALAGLMKPMERTLSRLGGLGAAFIAVKATKE